MCLDAPRYSCEPWRQDERVCEDGLLRYPCKVPGAEHIMSIEPCPKCGRLNTGWITSIGYDYKHTYECQRGFEGKSGWCRF